MSGVDRKPYLTATTLTQALLDDCHDNLENRLEMICDIEAPGGNTIYASDRNKYVGGVFYEALLVFPVIGRTVGDWLTPELQFSTLNLELSNVDGRFNNYLPGGADFANWIGKTVTVKLGIAEAAGTYTTVFHGTITDVGGFMRTVKSIKIIARDDYDKVNKTFPVAAFREAQYPKIEPKNIGKLLPVIYGDWTTTTAPAPASVPGFIVNGNDPMVTFKEKTIVNLTAPASPAVFTVLDHDFENDDLVQLTTSGTLPTPFLPAVDYYVQVTGQDTFELALVAAGASINSTVAGTGDHKVIAAPTASYRDLSLVVADRDLTFFDAESVYLKRNDIYTVVPSSEITVGGGNKSFVVAQNTAVLWVAAAAYTFESTDEFFVKVKGHDLPGFQDNLIEQARDILKVYGGLTSGEFHANWDTYRSKASPSQSAIVSIKSRVWINEAQTALSYALSMLEQVRLEAFIDRTLMVKINSLHFEDWNSAPTHKVKNWDVVRDSFQTQTEERNNFNAAQGAFNYLPDVNQNAYSTAIFQNAPAIAQIGKRIAKRIVFPNLYVQSQAEDQIKEILRLASSSFEVITFALTWRSLLQDIGGFVGIEVDIGSSVFDNVPAMIREIGYDPTGLKILAKVWSMAMVPFPGYVPGYTGTVGGYSATIVEET